METKPELVIERTIGAPRELVYAAFTDPKHIDIWWGPDGFRTTTHSMDVTIGGQWRYTMVAADGTVFENLVTYTEIARPERLCYDLGEPDDPVQFKVIATFEQAGAGTALTMRMLCLSNAQLENMKKYGAVESGQQTLAHLEHYLTSKETK
ncbi:MAG TPA: SRPBCC family protein [Telluria sp.]|jgi:uncharacterized protein YndB with AHSA1/START domain